MGTATKTAPAAHSHAGWSDEKLVRACVQSDQEAWAALIDRYKNLIFSIPIKYGFSREDAADLFQAVCVELLQTLPKLREPKALPKWLMQVTAHKCLRHKIEQSGVTTDLVDVADGLGTKFPERILQEAEQEQAVRTAIQKLPPRCRELVQLLFFETPARPYAEVAAQLGLASGSIGFIRGRCLEKLRKSLLEAGQR